MAKYVALAPLFLDGRLLPTGERFESDARPGAKWGPLDDAAKAAKSQPAPESTPGMAPLPPFNPNRELTPIPENWSELSRPEKIRLARSLGAPAKGTTAAKAEDIIKDELARRATV